MTRATKPGESSRQDIFTNWTAAVGGQQTRRRSRRVSAYVSAGSMALPLSVVPTICSTKIIATSSDNVRGEPTLSLKNFMGCKKYSTTGSYYVFFTNACLWLHADQTNR